MLRESVDLPGAPPVAPPPLGAIAIVRTLVASGSLATRLVVAGTLLVVGLPVLTILVYPSNSVPLPLVVLADGLQILIVLYAIVVVAQLLATTGIRASWMSGRHRPKAEALETLLPVQRSGPRELQELSLRLVEMIWEHERNGRAVFGPAVLDYLRDAVTAELTHRHRTTALEQRLAKLEVLLSEGSRAEGPSDQC